MVQRCDWCGTDPVYVDYHDHEWGVPVWDDRGLFELLILEGAQAGLAWITVLRKREGYRELFDGFDADAIAHYSDNKLERILVEPRIIRNRLKVFGARQNARAFLETQAQFGDFRSYVWQFVDGTPIVNAWLSVEDTPTSTPISVLLSKDMKRRGFTFVGPTIMYAFMQASGMVNDHIASCFCSQRER
ncbi:DNA-3-methyladenine glycosylase I [Kineobactrum sediminis]|uniref:DNA-3-methyladenine glycosylase I n=1 Tax=Kineobactrum sediminis TaxID=1905677 RepID=A0A2N5XZX4_9GAMM|nr:DNA-3-methyladenine glycosylase I [Kineobactrum sediminis]PLW81686.1 DNA-3-methyladenine glycosylase I [Kineobactrum sediminis]